MSNVIPMPVRSQNVPGMISNIDLTHIREHAVYVVTTAGGSEYYVTRDLDPEKLTTNSARTHVMVMMAPFGGEVTIEQVSLYAHSIIEVGKRWHISEDAEGGLEYTDLVESIELA